MTDETASITRDEIEAKRGSARPRATTAPHFRTVTILAAVLFALGLVLLLGGEVATSGYLLGAGLFTVLIVLTTGAIVWQTRESADRPD